MSHHIKVEEDYIKSLLSNAAWGAARVPLVEAKEEEVETVEEEVHSCPLCASVLDEALSEEVIGEHIETIEGILRLHEEEDLDEEDLEEQEDFGDDDGPESEKPGVEPTDADLDKIEGSKKSRVKKKVAGLKKKWTGQKKGDKPAKDKRGDKPDFSTGARKGDMSKTHAGKDFEKKA